jgi:membrane associated rhomboid family serine protease
MTAPLLAVTLIVSVLCFQRQDLLGRLMFNPVRIHQRNEWYRVVTSGFIHADWMHLLVNMFVLYSFGGVVEAYYNQVFGASGGNYFLLLYFGGIVFSILPSYRKHKEDPGYNALGASGAISAVVFAFILFNPLDSIYLYGVIRIPGILFGILYLAYCYWAAKKGGDHINHDAHFWGAVYGVLFTLVMKPALMTHFMNQLQSIWS